MSLKVTNDVYKSLLFKGLKWCLFSHKEVVVAKPQLSLDLSAEAVWFVLGMIWFLFNFCSFSPKVKSVPMLWMASLALLGLKNISVERPGLINEGFNFLKRKVKVYFSLAKKEKNLYFGFCGFQRKLMRQPTKRQVTVPMNPNHI